MSNRLRTAGVLAVLFLSIFAVAQERAISPYRDAARPYYKWEGAGAGGLNGFLATWFEWVDVPRLYGARLTRDGQLAGAPFFIGVAPWMPAEVHAEGDRYIVTVDDPQHFYQQTWEVSDDRVFDLGMLQREVDDPVENANGEHLVVALDGNGLDYTIWFVDRNLAQHGPPIHTRDIRPFSSVIQMRPVGDDWALLFADTKGVVQWLRIDHSRIVSMVNVLPPMPTTRPGSRRVSGFAMHGSDVALAWSQSSKIDNLEAPTWERILGYTTVNVESGDYRETRIDTTQMRIDGGDYRTPETGTPSAIFNGREFVYAWSWFDYAGNGEVRVVNGSAAPRVIARHHDVFPYDLRPVLGSGDGGRDLLMWHARLDRGRPNDRVNVLARAIDATSSIEDGVAPALVSPGIAQQRQPQQAIGPNGTFVAWTEAGDQTQVRGRFFPAASSAGDSFAIADLGGTVAVSVAANASTFLVAWRESNPVSPFLTRLYLRRYDANGAPIDAQPVSLGNGHYYGGPISVVADGESFVLAWSHNKSSFAMRVPSRGAVTVAPVKIFDAPDVADPYLVRAGGRILALWIANLGQSVFALRGAPMRDTLELEPSTDMWLTLTRFDAGVIRVAAEGTDNELMVALGGNASATEKTDCVRARRFGLNLQPLGDAHTLDCVELAAYGTENWTIPDVAWDGTRWWATYSQGGAMMSTLRLWPFDANGAPQTPKVVSFSQGVLDVTLNRAPAGLNASYTRFDENAALILRAYQLPLSAQPGKTRSARH